MEHIEGRQEMSETAKKPTNYRTVAFRNRAGRHIRKAVDSIRAVVLTGEHYRGYYSPEDAKAIVEGLRAELDALERELSAAKPKTTFAWPTP